MPRTQIHWLRGMLAFVAVTALAIPIVYFAAIAIHPPRTPDGHPVMPIGQVAVALLLGPSLGLVTAVIVARRP